MELSLVKQKNDQRKKDQAEVSQKMRLYFLNDFGEEIPQTKQIPEQNSISMELSLVHKNDHHSR